MKQLYIHVGAHKTATTFLQWDYFPFLEELDYGYSSSPNEAYEIIARTIQAHDLTFDAECARARLLNFMNGSAKEKILVSREGLFGDLYHSYFDNPGIAERIARLYPEARIIIVVRRQDTWLRSAYSQSLKGGNFNSLERFLNFRVGEFHDGDHQVPTLNFTVRDLNWHAFARNYARLFGRDNILVLAYEAFLEDQAAFLRKLESFMGISEFHPPRNIVRNPKLSAVSEQLILILNRLFKTHLNPGGFIPTRPYYDYLAARCDDGLLFRFLYSLSGRMAAYHLCEHYVDKLFKRPPPPMPSDLSRKIMEIHGESNRRLDEEFNVRLASYGYY